MQIEGKVFVVTGGGNGIGREVTLDLLRRGALVAAVDLDKRGLGETAALAAAGDRLSTHVVNVTDRAAVAALPKAVIAAHGTVDGLLNVAGVIQKFVKVIDLPFEEIDKVMNVNFGGVIAMCKAFLPHLLERPEAALLNVASMGAFAAVPGQAVYGASKAAVSLLTEALYAELMGTHVAVTAIYPGAIATNIAANSGVGIPGASDAKTSDFKMTAPAEAARVIIRAIEKGKFRDTIGSDASALDKFHRFSPKRATEMIAKKMASLLG
jgi:NAD(P)-dependent dehydrogenase (short-subunit alcohol dehydrogenase family)